MYLWQKLLSGDNNLETLKGKLNNLKITKINNGTKALNVATFNLKNRNVEYKTPNSLMMTNGDTVIIAGVQGKYSTFKAYSCKNLG